MHTVCCTSASSLTFSHIRTLCISSTPENCLGNRPLQTYDRLHLLVKQKTAADTSCLQRRNSSEPIVSVSVQPDMPSQLLYNWGKGRQCCVQHRYGTSVHHVSQALSPPSIIPHYSDLTMQHTSPAINESTFRTATCGGGALKTYPRTGDTGSTHPIIIIIANPIPVPDHEHIHLSATTTTALPLSSVARMNTKSLINTTVTTGWTLQ